MGLTITKDYENLPLIFHELKIHDLPVNEQSLIHQIEQVLPQTQCGLCGHREGCLPYAHAIVTEGEATNLCVPGGNAVSQSIANLMGKTYLPAQPSAWDIDESTQRPMEVRAVIREDECIGCTKCIVACPVDAIIGTAKHMHSILLELCTGCELCLPPCPVDCIELVPHPRVIDDESRVREQRFLRHRYHEHLRRVEQQATTQSPTISIVQSKVQNVLQNTTSNPYVDKDIAKDAIAAAKLRTQLKKLNKQMLVADAQQKDRILKEIEKINHELQRLNNA